jgi:hypothetical protein
VPRVKYAMDYRPKNSFSMSYASRKVIFPGEGQISINDQAITDIIALRSILNNL